LNRYVDTRKRSRAPSMGDGAPRTSRDRRRSRRFGTGAFSFGLVPTWRPSGERSTSASLPPFGAMRAPRVRPQKCPATRRYDGDFAPQRVLSSSRPPHAAGFRCGRCPRRGDVVFFRINLFRVISGWGRCVIESVCRRTCRNRCLSTVCTVARVTQLKPQPSDTPFFCCSRISTLLICARSRGSGRLVALDARSRCGRRDPRARLCCRTRLVKFRSAGVGDELISSSSRTASRKLYIGA